jgi:hypothetical protein
VVNKIAAGVGLRHEERSDEARNKLWIRDRPVTARNKSLGDYKLRCKETAYHQKEEIGTLEDLQKVMRL